MFRDVVKTIVVLLLTLTLSTPSRAAATAREYEIKAAFIFNFMEFITWPPDAFIAKDAPFVVAVVGDDPFGGALEQAMAGKTVDGRQIVVRHFPSADQMEPCQVLFVPTGDDDALPAIMAKLASAPVLTVGESDRFMAAGGGIRFFLEDNKMRFEIDPAATDAARLKVSAKLMKLARIYQR
jgi:hypothetical protein